MPSKPRKRSATAPISIITVDVEFRDFIAMHALMGILAGRREDYPYRTDRDWSEQSYRLADAMLKARGKR